MANQERDEDGFEEEEEVDRLKVKSLRESEKSWKCKIKKECDLANQERDEEGFEDEEKVENVQINQSFDAKMQKMGLADDGIS